MWRSRSGQGAHAADPRFWAYGHFTHSERQRASVSLSLHFLAAILEPAARGELGAFFLHDEIGQDSRLPSWPTTGLKLHTRGAAHADIAPTGLDAAEASHHFHVAPAG